MKNGRRLPGQGSRGEEALRLLKQGDLEGAALAARHIQQLRLTPVQAQRATAYTTTISATSIDRHFDLKGGDYIEAEFLDGSIVLRRPDSTSSLSHA